MRQLHPKAMMLLRIPPDKITNGMVRYLADRLRKGIEELEAADSRFRRIEDEAAHAKTNLIRIEGHVEGLEKMIVEFETPAQTPSVPPPPPDSPKESEPPKSNGAEIGERLQEAVNRANEEAGKAALEASRKPKGKVVPMVTPPAKPKEGEKT